MTPAPCVVLMQHRSQQRCVSAVCQHRWCDSPPRPQVPRSCQCLLMSATSSADLERLQALVLHNPLELDLLALSEAEAAAAGGGAGGAAGAATEIEHFSLPCAE